MKQYVKNLFETYKTFLFSNVQGDYINDPYRTMYFQDDKYSGDAYLFTDMGIMNAQHYDSSYKIALLLEVYDLVPSIYDYLLKSENQQNFNKILTFDKNIYETNPDKCIFYSFGGCWIPPDEQKIYSKNKMTSIIVSNKRQLPAHKLRHQIVNMFGNYLDGVFGSGYKYIQTKTEGLADYCYSIVVENNMRDWYFSEKLIDCFATGTIPIYRGPKCVDDFFDSSAIIHFDTLQNLYNILKNVSYEDYTDRLQGIENNFKQVAKYIYRDF